MFQITGITQPKGLIFTDYKSLLGNTVSYVLRYAIIGAGLLFFVRLISAGYSMMTSGGDSGKAQNASKEIAHAVTGLVIVLCAFFIAQILQVVFGISILGLGGSGADTTGGN